MMLPPLPEWAQDVVCAVLIVAAFGFFAWGFLGDEPPSLEDNDESETGDRE